MVFETGAIRDLEDKEDYVETISWVALQRYAKYMTEMAKKYGRGNWKKGIPIDSYEQSLVRHIQKYIANKYEGANLEPEVDHLSAIMFNVQGLMMEEEKLKKAGAKNIKITLDKIVDDLESTLADRSSAVQKKIRES